MTYQEFKDKYNNQWIDWDGAYGCQCRLGLGTKVLY